MNPNSHHHPPTRLRQTTITTLALIATTGAATIGLAGVAHAEDEIDFRSPSGDILCAMRSGGRIGVHKAPIFPTPLYVARSHDEGRSWTPPVPIADRGVCPYLVTFQVIGLVEVTIDLWFFT